MTWFARAAGTLRRILRHRNLDYNRANAERARSFCRVRGRRVLVVGCNTGGDCRYFVRFGAASVVGIDVIQAVGTEFQHPRVTYHRASAEAMPFAEGTFDLVYSVATMEHIPEIGRAFSEMSRVTARGGVVYCFAAPLWNSRFGHHKPDLFGDVPWIHLRMSEEEIVRHARKRGITSDGPIEEHVRYMLSDEYFNKVPASRYIEVCAVLPSMKALYNELSHEPPDMLPANVAAELGAKGFSPDELLAVCHTYVGVKAG